MKEGIKSAEENRELEREQKRTSRHQRTQPVPTSHTTPATDYTGNRCQRRCESRIGLYSHSRRCCDTDCLHIAMVSRDRSLPSTLILSTKVMLPQVYVYKRKSALPWVHQC
ncbi:hypothetical protein ElyMa_002274100 [Elysia marginata]|uniref:Uncharacterized protein n=1 Tax=Elysia marginata TaxID=1093978 RepID=A0AAV4G129_9GAST|nr:hypothetical protein ElyMa_002274100 [Elysia marginata]